MKSILTTEDYNSFWIYLYFNTHSPTILHCMERAYRDFNRTVHGLKRLNDTTKTQLKTDAHKCLISRLTALSTAAGEQISQTQFDHWHQTVCQELCEIYRAHGFDNFRIGQAQKWINMTFKYLFVLGEERIPGFEDIYPFCHIPIDNIMIEAFKGHNAPELPCAWSRINDYATYLNFQQWIRKTFTEPPLDVEFKLWMRDESEDGLSWLL